MILKRSSREVKTFGFLPFSIKEATGLLNVKIANGYFAYLRAYFIKY